MGIQNAAKYNNMTCTDASGSFVIGQDLTSDLFFRGTWSSIAHQDTTILVDFHAHLDMGFVIIDDQMISHWYAY